MPRAELSRREHCHHLEHPTQAAVLRPSRSGQFCFKSLQDGRPERGSEASIPLLFLHSTYYLQRGGSSLFHHSEVFLQGTDSGLQSSSLHWSLCTFTVSQSTVSVSPHKAERKIQPMTLTVTQALGFSRFSPTTSRALSTMLGALLTSKPILGVGGAHVARVLTTGYHSPVTGHPSKPSFQGG